MDKDFDDFVKGLDVDQLAAQAIGAAMAGGEEDVDTRTFNFLFTVGLLRRYHDWLRR